MAFIAPAKLIIAPAQLITAPAQLITAPAQPPATEVAVYTALFFSPRSTREFVSSVPNATSATREWPATISTFVTPIGEKRRRVRLIPSTTW